MDPIRFVNKSKREKQNAQIAKKVPYSMVEKMRKALFLGDKGLLTSFTYFGKNCRKNHGMRGLTVRYKSNNICVFCTHVAYTRKLREKESGKTAAELDDKRRRMKAMEEKKEQLEIDNLFDIC